MTRPRRQRARRPRARSRRPQAPNKNASATASQRARRIASRHRGGDHALGGIRRYEIRRHGPAPSRVPARPRLTAPAGSSFRARANTAPRARAIAGRPDRSSRCAATVTGAAGRDHRCSTASAIGTTSALCRSGTSAIALAIDRSSTGVATSDAGAALADDNPLAPIRPRQQADGRRRPTRGSATAPPQIARRPIRRRRGRAAARRSRSRAMRATASAIQGWLNRGGVGEAVDHGLHAT